MRCVLYQLADVRCSAVWFVLNGEEDVFWFEVPVHDAVSVAVGDGGDDLSEEAAALFLCQLPLVQDVVVQLAC